MNYISLFSGIGGFDLAFNRAGMECVGMCEIDKNCQNVLHRHFEHVHIFDDVKQIGASDYERGAIDVICGGFPCQDLSVAGKRTGLAGERSGLWWEFARIIDELEPRWVVIENVPGLLSSNKGRDFAAIIQWLAKRGYGVAWRVLDAQYFGVPQRRRRVFIVASFGSGRAAEILFEREGVPGDTPPRREAGEEVAPTIAGVSNGGGASGPGRDVDSVTSLQIVPKGVGHSGGETLKLNDISNSINGQTGSETTAFFNGVMCMAHGQANAEIVKDGEPSLTTNHEAPILAFRPNNSSKARGLGVGVDVSPTLPSEEGGNKVCVANWQSGGGKMDDEVAASLRAGAEHSAQFVWHNHQQDGSIRMQENGTVPTVSRQRGTGGNNVPLVGIRRFTPRECERLQGFPDGWTDGQSDSARYRQLGNAVAPVVEWIARRINPLPHPAGMPESPESGRNDTLGKDDA